MTPQAHRPTPRCPNVLLTLCCAAAAIPLLLSGHAAAELPEAEALLKEVGLSAAEIARIESGELVEHGVTAASDRELTTGLAFQVPVPPGELVKQARRDLLDRVDENMIAFGTISSPAAAADFAKLSLSPDQTKAYRGAEAGGDLHLSTEEIAAFQKLGDAANPAAVEKAVREALAARVQAYRSSGLSGVAPYALGGGKERSAAEEIRTAVQAAKHLEKYAPDAHALLLSYPKQKPEGTEEVFRWSHFEAHGVPTLALTHTMLVPEGDGFILSRRQFYVSTGYNAEQALAAFLPSKGGTVVVYATRTSTDQVTGFGGSAKRSIGSKLLASQLEELFQKARKQVQ